MNRWTGTGHLTKDPKLLETTGGTAICASRLTSGSVGLHAPKWSGKAWRPRPGRGACSQRPNQSSIKPAAAGFAATKPSSTASTTLP